MTNPVAIGIGRDLGSDYAIENEAERLAKMCARCGFSKALTLVERAEVEFPRGDNVFSQYARLKCPKWWRRKLRRLHWRSAEQSERRAGRVYKMEQVYCSDHSVNRHRVSRSGARGFLADMVAVNKSTGEIATLESAAEHGVSNPKVRRSELLARVRGLEEYARSKNWRCEFWTLTTPSRFHLRYPNGQYIGGNIGATPRDAQDWIQLVWSRARAAFDDIGLDYCGLRIAEPHHDGTPHAHILIMMDREKAVQAGKIMQALATADDCPQIIEARFKPVILSANRSAVGYVVKYVCKAIDGHGVGVDLNGLDAVDGAARVSAWASLWGIRQFQFFGVARIGPWRELRRVEAVEGAIPEELQPLHEAARDGRYFDFLSCEGALAIETLKGEPERGQYGDAVVAVVGVALGIVELTTREDWEIVPAWTLEQVSDYIPAPRVVVPVEEWALGAKLAQCVQTLRGSNPAARTRLNNCRETQGHGQKETAEPPD